VDTFDRVCVRRLGTMIVIKGIVFIRPSKTKVDQLDLLV
jgi:hypothetical protein